MPLGDSVCRQAVGGGVQLHPAVLVLYETFRPQHMAARGVGEEGRDILFELLAREAQLQKVGRTKGPMRLALPASNYSTGRIMRLIAERLKSEVRSGRTILVITHDRKLIESCCDNIVEVEKRSS